MDPNLCRSLDELTPSDVVAELLALSIVEHTYTPNIAITIELDDTQGLLTDTGRGMRLTPDSGDTISHAERALTSIYPVVPTRRHVEAALVELIWGDRGSLGPSLANAACPELEFTSRRDGEAWSQRYRYGLPEGPASMVGRTDASGTTMRFKTSGPIDADAIQALVTKLRIRIPNLRIAGPKNDDSSRCAFGTPPAVVPFGDGWRTGRSYSIFGSRGVRKV